MSVIATDTHIAIARKTLLSIVELRLGDLLHAKDVGGHLLDIRTKGIAAVLPEIERAVGLGQQAHVGCQYTQFLCLSLRSAAYKSQS